MYWLGSTSTRIEMQWFSNHVDQNHRWKKLSFHGVFTNLYQVSLWLFGTIVSTVVWRFHFKTKPAKQPVVQMGSSAPLHSPFLQHLFDWAVTSSRNQTGNPQKMNSFLLVRFPKPACWGQTSPRASPEEEMGPRLWEKQEEAPVWPQLLIRLAY